MAFLDSTVFIFLFVFLGISMKMDVCLHKHLRNETKNPKGIH